MTTLSDCDDITLFVLINVHLAPESLCVAGVVGELDRIDGVHLEAQQLQGEGGGLVSHIT